MDSADSQHVQHDFVEESDTGDSPAADDDVSSDDFEASDLETDSTSDGNDVDVELATMSARSGADRESPAGDANGRNSMPPPGPSEADDVARDSEGEASEGPRAEPDARNNGALTRAEGLADRLSASNRQAAEQLRSLAVVAFTTDAAQDDALAWSGVDPLRAFDVDSMAAGAAASTARLFGSLAWTAEFIRNLLVFVPVLVTWVALGVASRVYATCHMTRRGEELQSFLFLWQQGFRTTNDALSCDLSVVDGPFAGFASFNEVVFLDAIALGGIIALTALAHAAGTVQSARRTAAAADIASELKSVLVDASKRLYRIRATHEEDATGRMVVGALADLRNVAAEFSATAAKMLVTLEERARTAESHLDDLSRAYAKIARDAESTSTKLATVLERTTETAHGLSASVERASAEFTGLGTKIEGASGALTERLAAAEEHLMSVDAAVRRLVALDEKSQDTRTAILDHAKMTTGITPLIQAVVNVEDRVRKLSGEIRYLADRKVMALPRAGWQFGVGAIAMLALFQLLTLLAVVGAPGAEADQSQPAASTRAPLRTPELTPDLFIPAAPSPSGASLTPTGPQ